MNSLIEKRLMTIRSEIDAPDFSQIRNHRLYDKPVFVDKLGAEVTIEDEEMYEDKRRAIKCGIGAVTNQILELLRSHVDIQSFYDVRDRSTRLRASIKVERKKDE